MGYSVHVNINQRQLKKLQKVFDGLDFSDLYIRGPLWYSKDLSYYPDKESICFGFDYGAYEYAHNIVCFVARKLGKKTYWYDGNEKCKVEETFWWQNPPETWSDYRKQTYPYMTEIYDKIKLIFEQLEQKFNEYKNS